MINTILLINGSQVLMDITRRILERSGYCVKCAIGFSEARLMLAEHQPDVIVLEDDLPDGSGLDFCWELRRKGTTPILFLSNNKDDELHALRAGATDFLKKPFDFEIMKARIAAMINNSQQTIVLGTQVQQTPAEKTIDPKEPVDDLEKPENQIRVFAKTSHMYFAAAMFLVCALAVTVLFKQIQDYQTAEFEIIGKSTPTASSPYPELDANAKIYDSEYDSIEIPIIENLNFINNKADYLLLNPKNNSCYLLFEIILTDKTASKSIFASDLIPPGMCIDEINLAKTLNPGNYSAVVKIRAYSMESLDIINSVEVQINIISAAE